MNNSETLIYQATDGKIKIDVRLEDETVRQKQEDDFRAHPLYLQ